jgi:phosphoribosyl 1,2-cyclic phosphodiesterase
MDGGLQIRFWGVRGNVAPLQASAEFGNHTTCLEVGAAGFPSVLVDLGSGAVPAARELLARGIRDFEIFQTHLHLDHMQGLFAFAPLYHEKCAIRWHAARPDLEAAVRALMAPPFHPVSFSAVAARVDFEALPESGARKFPHLGLTVGWTPLAHPQGCTAYRFDDGRNAVVVATDVELGAAAAHPGLERLLREPYPAGLALVDGTYTDDELPRHAGWGHSSWTQARALADRCGVGRVVIVHHHPAKTDAELAALEDGAGSLRWAREGGSLRLSGNRLE